MKFSKLLVICLTVFSYLVMTGCSAGERFSPEAVQAFDEPAVFKELERVVGKSEGRSRNASEDEYLLKLKDRLAFLNPYWNGDIESAQSLRRGWKLAIATRQRVEQLEKDKERYANQAPNPASLDKMTEEDIYRELELLERGELSGGYADEQLADYGKLARAENAAAGTNWDAREEFARQLKLRLCKLHRQWSRETCSNILRGKVAPGMNEDQVRAAVGHPSSVLPIEGPGKADEKWTFEGGLKVLTKKGQVVSVEGGVEHGEKGKGN